MEPTLALLAAGGNTLVAVSARFDPVGSYATLIAPFAHDSLTLWYATERCFFFSTDSTFVTLETTDLLSHMTFDALAIGKPFIRSLYRSASFISIATVE